MTAPILVVDDDPAICDTVEDALHLAGHATLRASNGDAALEIIRHQRVSLVVLDVNMPKVSGFDVLRRLRALKDATPVILLTARDDRNDVIEGFRVGADDYVTKPFGLEELLLRIAAVLRRTTVATTDVLRCAGLSIDRDRHMVTVDNSPIELSPTEFRLLEYLLENQGRVMSREQILDAVWGIDFDSSTTVVETFISYLRRKLGPSGPNYIKTIRGVGITLREPT
ncbi:MAG: putative transcriptional regulatory protein TcrX [Actinomycetota bacterium]|jgi:two-component system OmpR family response regulator